MSVSWLKPIRWTPQTNAVFFPLDIVSMDETRHGVNVKLEIWIDALVFGSVGLIWTKT